MCVISDKDFASTYEEAMIVFELEMDQRASWREYLLSFIEEVNLQDGNEASRQVNNGDMSARARLLVGVSRHQKKMCQQCDNVGMGSVRWAKTGYSQHTCELCSTQSLLTRFASQQLNI